MNQTARAYMDLTSHYKQVSFYTVIILALAGLPGCASTPPAQQKPAPELVSIAQTPVKSKAEPHLGLSIASDMVGSPYRYGGADPRGFDCSGLVYYAYRKAGIQISRTTAEQYRQSKRVTVSQLQPGDLLFFTISRDKLSHVGIYAGKGRFIHAPSSGRLVSYASLDDPYWRRRLIGAGRL